MIPLAQQWSIDTCKTMDALQMNSSVEGDNFIDLILSGLYTAASSVEIRRCNQICRRCNLDRTGLVRLVRLVRFVLVVSPSSRRLQKKKSQLASLEPFTKKDTEWTMLIRPILQKKQERLDGWRNIYMICWEKNVEHISHRVRTYRLDALREIETSLKTAISRWTIAHLLELLTNFSPSQLNLSVPKRRAKLLTAMPISLVFLTWNTLDIFNI